MEGVKWSQFKAISRKERGLWEEKKELLEDTT